MRKLSNIVIIFMGCTLLCLFSCTKDLKLTPTSIISVNSFWKTADDAQGGLYGMYNQFRTLAASNLYIMGEARSEIMGNGLQNADFRVKYMENSMDATNADLNWQQPYKIIGFANLVIKNVPGISFPKAADKNSILAQAYAMRAFLYFTLTKTWGDLPLLTEPAEGFDPVTTYKERVPVSQIFDLIRHDIDTALQLFPDNAFPTGRSVWSKPAVNMLKGDVYLWTGKRMGGGEADFKTALDALNAAQQSDVALLDKFSDVFNYTNKGNKEILFAVHFEDLESSNNYFADMYIQPADIPPTLDPESAAILGTGGGYNWWAPSALVRNEFTDDDQRKNASFLNIYSHADGTPSFVTSVVLKGQGLVKNGLREFLNDIVIYRYSELLLLKAEAENALGQDPSAEINAVRERAYGTHFADHQFVNAGKLDNDKAILQERLFELAYEGKRWWDLVRFGQAFNLVPSLKGRDADQYLLLFPITRQTITLNPNITQNKGY